MGWIREVGLRNTSMGDSGGTESSTACPQLRSDSSEKGRRRRRERKVTHKRNDIKCVTICRGTYVI